MSENKAIRLSKLAREFNVGISTIVEFLQKKGHNIDSNPNTKIEPELYDLLLKEYSSDLDVKKKSESFSLQNLREKKDSLTIEDAEEVPEQEEEEEQLLIKDVSASPSKPEKKPVEQPEEEEPVAEKVKPASGPKVLGKVDLSSFERRKPDKKKEEEKKKAVEEEEKKAKKTEASKEEKSEKEPESEEKKEEKKKSEKEDHQKETKQEEKVQEVEQDTEKKEEKKDKEEGNGEIKTVIEKLSGPTVVGKIDLPKKPSHEKKKKPVASSSGPQENANKKKRKRIRKDDEGGYVKRGTENAEKSRKGRGKKKKLHRPEVNEEDVQKQVKDTLAKLTAKGKSKGSKYRRDKRDSIQQKKQAELEQQELDKRILKITEFVSVSELANLMDVPVNEVIQTCMNLGLFVSINQRLDAETLVLVADEFDFTIEFISAELQDTVEVEEEEDAPEDLAPRSPIVTVMGHVDHGKTKLLDYVRNANVIAGEAGGITQHIGAYAVELEDNRKITFLDTPGHEAFTAMRARGAQVTDIAIIVVAADDGVKPQTVEAINHASAAGVPIVFAINKIDKSTANPDKIKEELANMNYLVEDWGGKYQSQDISAKGGIGIEDLLEKVLLEAEMLDLKANPKKRASGTVIESSLDKGRGYVATILVEDGTLNVGDIVLAGSHFGHVKAMYNERGSKIDTAGPATPVLILGLNGAPQAGDRFVKMETDREAKEIATKREQLQREQETRTQKHITLDEIGRRIAIGNFKELNLIVKGDVDGSVEALSDSLEKLSTEEIQVNIKHKAVGQISESDILLAAASNAIVIGFQVRPSLSARKIAEREQIDIRLYSIIYDAIEEIKSAMEGMLSPEIREEITATLEVLQTFRITKTGTIAGCIVKEGKIKRDSKVRIIRDGIVVYTGELGSLKRFKDDVKEAVSGQECGLNIENFNDVKVGDNIEAYTETQIKKKL